MIARILILLSSSFLAVILLATPADATIVFNWTGNCGGFPGCVVGTGSGTLTLSNTYVLGTPLTSADFVSLTYQSPFYSVDLNGGSVGCLPFPDIDTCGFDADGTMFDSGGAGIDFFGTDLDSVAGPNINIAFDLDGTVELDGTHANEFLTGLQFSPAAFVSVPEPPSWLLMLAGLFCFGVAQAWPWQWRRDASD